MLTDRGYKVLTTTSAVEGFDLLRANKVDLVLLDVHMPEKNGFTLYREFEDYQHVPVLFVTGCPKSFTGTSEEFVEMWNKHFIMGTTDILYKPFNIDLLFEKVESLIGSAEAMTHEPNF